MAGLDRGIADGKLSVLFLSPAWQCDGYGIASITRSLASDLKRVDPEGEGMRMTCAVVQEENKISDKDQEDAKEHNVTLKAAKISNSMRSKTVPKMSWLDTYTGTYYRHIMQADDIDFVVGHIPYLADGALNVQELCKEQGQLTQVVLFVHSLPKTEHGNINENLLLEWLQGADIVLSVGSALFTRIEDYLLELDGPHPKHRLYIPGCPVDLFDIARIPRGEPIRGPQHIIVIAGERKELNVKGIDYELAVGASAKAANKIHDNAMVTTDFWTVGSTNQERPAWEEQYNNIHHKVSPDDKRLTFTYKTMEDKKDFRNILKRASISVLPLRPDSSLFGTEALMAAYAGVPVLVSKHSGVAELLKEALAAESVLPIHGAFKRDTDDWCTPLFKKIMNAKDAEQEAADLRKYLLLNTKIDETHYSSVNVIIGKCGCLI